MSSNFNILDAGTFIVFLVGAILMLVLCFYVLGSAASHKERRQVPAYLMIGRTISDFVFGILFFIMIFISKYSKSYISSSKTCDHFAMFLIWCFLVSALYFASICYDIYRTLTNPFSRPISNSLFIHLLCWIISAIFIFIFSLNGNIAWDYRIDYQICFIRWTSDFNISNLVLLYLPIIIINFLGFIVSVWSLRRLRVKVLDATFECRWKVLRRQFFITLCYTFSYFISFIFWLPIAVKSFQATETPSKAVNQPYFILMIVVAQLFGDAIAWYYSNYFARVRSIRSRRILQLFGLITKMSIIDMQNDNLSHISVNSSQNQNKNPNDYNEELIDPHNKGNIEKNKPEDTDATQDLSNALRREVVAYMTKGIAKSIENTANETNQYLNTRAESIIDNGYGNAGASSSSSSSKSNTNTNLALNNININNENDENDELNENNRKDPIDQIEPVPKLQLYSKSLGFRSTNDSIRGLSINNQYELQLSEEIDDDKSDVLDKLGNLGIKMGSNNVFMDYAPHVFRYLRTKIYNINESDYLSSIEACFNENDENNINNHIRSHFSEGASGAFFFFTFDQKYIIKTVVEGEAKLLLNILEKYVEYCETEKQRINNENNKNPNPELKSFLNKFFGLYCLEYYKKIYFVVINNLLVPNEEPQEKYDIKGSWIDRHTNYHTESGKLMKDEDIHKRLELDPNESNKYYKQLFRDTEFLSSVGIMDYSLLLGIYYMQIDRNMILKNENDDNKNNDMDLERSYTIDDKQFEYPPVLRAAVAAAGDRNIANKWKRPRSHSFFTGMERVGNYKGAVIARKMEGPCVYFFGIIDMLQAWNTQKKWEHFVKVFLMCKDKKGVSCVNPQFYQIRFMKQMCDLNIRPLQ